MKQRVFLVTILSVAVMNSAQAKCVNHPEIRATAAVEECVAVTFAASETRFTIGGKDWGPKYRAGEILSGTLLSVTVKTSRFIWPDHSAHWINGAHLWIKGESRSLFVRKAPAEACPANLPTDIVVRTQRVCCDTMPGGWECLLPQAVSLVDVVETK
jgi:hypothetical protein